MSKKVVAQTEIEERIIKSIQWRNDIQRRFSSISLERDDLNTRLDLVTSREVALREEASQQQREFVELTKELN